jgi:hypothetical protein
MGNYYARFGGGRMEKGPQGYLASRLPTAQGQLRWGDFSPTAGLMFHSMTCFRCHCNRQKEEGQARHCTATARP